MWEVQQFGPIGGSLVAKFMQSVLSQDEDLIDWLVDSSIHWLIDPFIYWP